MPTFIHVWDEAKFLKIGWNTFGDIGFLLGQFTGLKWGISYLVDGLSFHLVIAKLKYLLTWNFRPKFPLSTRMRWSKVFENRLNTFGDMGFLVRQFTGIKWEISNLVDELSFHLVIAKVRYVLTWNFRPKYPHSTSLRWSKFFENRLNTLEIWDFCWDSLHVESGKFLILSMG